MLKEKINLINEINLSPPLWDYVALKTLVSNVEEFNLTKYTEEDAPAMPPAVEIMVKEYLEKDKNTLSLIKNIEQVKSIISTAEDFTLIRYMNDLETKEEARLSLSSFSGNKLLSYLEEIVNSSVEATYDFDQKKIELTPQEANDIVPREKVISKLTQYQLKYFKKDVELSISSSKDIIEISLKNEVEETPELTGMAGIMDDIYGYATLLGPIALMNIDTPSASKVVASGALVLLSGIRFVQTVKDGQNYSSKKSNKSDIIVF